jgi:hypothetical protein
VRKAVVGRSVILLTRGAGDNGGLLRMLVRRLVTRAGIGA